MRKILINIICAFIPSRNFRHKLRKSMKKTIFESFLPRKHENARLIVITGIISLINAQVILNKNSKKLKNYLIIHSSAITDDFIKLQKKIILPHIFKKVIFVKNSELGDLDNPEFLEYFTEIFSTAQPIFKYLFNMKNIYLIEEGTSSYFTFENIVKDNIQGVFLSNYMGVMEHTDSDMREKVIRIDKDISIKTINHIKHHAGLNFSNLYKENQVLMLAHYCFGDILDDKSHLLFYKKHIDFLIDNGFKVLFKGHPRLSNSVYKDLTLLYKKNPNFSMFPSDINYPVEIVISDIKPVAIATAASGGAFSCSHLYNIPSFGFGARISKKHPAYYVSKYADLFLEHIPHITKIKDIL